MAMNAPNAPFGSYGLYLHPVDKVESTLPANTADMQYFTNKGFVFLGYVDPPGVVPVDVVRVESGGGAPRGASREQREQEQNVDRMLRENGVEGDQADRIRATLAAKGLAPRPPMTHLDPNTTTMPGELVATGVTRGVRGIDVTMPSVVPGISATDQSGQRDAVLRGEVSFDQREVKDAAGNTFTMQVPQPTAPEKVAEQRQRTMEQRGGRRAASTIGVQEVVTNPERIPLAGDQVETIHSASEPDMSAPTPPAPKAAEDDKESKAPARAPGRPRSGGDK
jgi:hypothetical protein